MLKRFYSEQLDSRQSDAYYTIDGAIRAYRNDCMLYGVTVEDSRRALEAVVNENPDVYACAVQFVQMQRSSQGVRLRFFYHDCDEGKFVAEKRKIFEELDKKIHSYTSDYEVAKLAYEYLASTVKPEDSVMQDFQRLDKNASSQLEEFVRSHGKSFTAYGAIVEKRAVCMGVALAYKMILDHYRVETAVATGQVDDVPHMLNVVEIDGKRSFVDITRGFWDEEFPMNRYDVFMVNENRIKKYFEADVQFHCNGVDHEYFYRNKLCFKDSYSLQRYLNSVIYQNTGGEIRFLYTGKALTDRRIGNVIADILPCRCGTEYELGGYLVQYGVGNCLMKKIEE